MKLSAKLSLILAAAVCLAIPTHSLANYQSKSKPMAKSLKRRSVMPPKRAEKRYSIPSKGNDACASRRAVLRQEQKKLDTYRADLSEMNSEIAELQRRIRDLRREAKRAKKQVRSQNKRVTSIRRVYKSQCEKNENCSQYEDMAENIGVQMQPVEDDINGIRRQINDARTSVQSLRQRINPIRREYTAKKCGNLVPGQTRQETIDRCMSLFSDWNRLQGVVNRDTNRLTNLRSRYTRYLNQLESLEKRAKSVEKFLARNCKESPKVAKVRGYLTVRQKAQLLGRELDELIKDTREMRKMKINTLPKK